MRAYTTIAISGASTFGGKYMPDVERRCGLCVHRNGHDVMPTAFCAVMGVRKRDDPPCDHFFPKDQLRAPLYGKRTFAVPKIEELF